MSAETALSFPLAKQHDGDARLRDRLTEFHSLDVVVAVVGYAGSGTSYVASQLKLALEAVDFYATVIKAREVLGEWARQKGQPEPSSLGNRAEIIRAYQDLGDGLRRDSMEYGAVAGWMASRIHELRRQTERDAHRVYILDSLKHPAEVELLRQIYGDGFRLLAVGCRPDVRKTRLEIKFKTQEDDAEVEELIARDAEDSANDYGQQVNETFHLADFFIDNTVDATHREGYRLADTLKDVFEKLFTRIPHHPSRDEQGLYFADAAALRSACLSRQVGAAILDAKGCVLAVGSNDVPMAGGGRYDSDEYEKGRCHVRGHCSNKRYQQELTDEVLSVLEAAQLPVTKVEELRQALKKTRMGSLLEFSRSVHAEMDALISLARAGIAISEGCTLYTTTYPCHNCARHIVAAGIKHVVYLEPYTKSLAVELHDDAIADNLPKSERRDRVRFEPYQGVAPRLYQTVYRQWGERKDRDGRSLPEETGRMLRTKLTTKTFEGLESECEAFVRGTVDDNAG